jgi:hypothetical protein
LAEEKPRCIEDGKGHVWLGIYFYYFEKPIFNPSLHCETSIAIPGETPTLKFP